MIGRLLVFFGDSYVNGTRDPEMLGWCGRLARRTAESGQPVTCCNLGIRGETIANLEGRVKDELLRRLHPDLAPRVIISAGTNDTATVGGRRRVTEEDSLIALRRIIEAVRPQAPLLLIGPPALPDARHSESNRRLSIKMATLCETLDLPFVEMWGITAGSAAWIRECAEDDGFHPGAAGYQVFADAVWSTPAWGALFTKGDQGHCEHDHDGLHRRCPDV